MDRHVRHISSNTVQNKVFFTKQQFRETLVKLLVKNALPYNFVSSNELQALLNMARNTESESDVSLPSPNTMKRLVNSSYDQAKIEISSLLHDQDRISFTCDVWTSGEGVSGYNDFLGVVAHFIDRNWNPRQVLIGFEVLEEGHTGIVFKIENFLYTITFANCFLW